MIKSMTALLLGWLALAGAAVIAPDVSQAQSGSASSPGSEPVLLELFTSQGCSSCPPADRLAARLAQEPGLVVISRPVTYWDRLGWKDTLAREENTNLQRTYARRNLEGRNGVYTPQIVTDGMFGAVGSRERQVRGQIARARPQRSAIIRVQHGENGDIGIGIGGRTNRRAELVLMAVSSHETVQIGRGENRGRSIGYTNVLLNETVIGSWQGGKGSHLLRGDMLQYPGADRFALVLRVPGGGDVLAARWIA